MNKSEPSHLSKPDSGLEDKENVTSTAKSTAKSQTNTEESSAFSGKSKVDFDSLDAKYKDLFEESLSISKIIPLLSEGEEVKDLKTSATNPRESNEKAKDLAKTTNSNTSNDATTSISSLKSSPDTETTQDELKEINSASDSKDAENKSSWFDWVPDTEKVKGIFGFAKNSKNEKSSSPEILTDIEKSPSKSIDSSSSTVKEDAQGEDSDTAANSTKTSKFAKFAKFPKFSKSSKGTDEKDSVTDSSTANLNTASNSSNSSGSDTDPVSDPVSDSKESESSTSSKFFSSITSPKSWFTKEKTEAELKKEQALVERKEWLLSQSQKFHPTHSGTRELVKSVWTGEKDHLQLLDKFNDSHDDQSIVLVVGVASSGKSYLISSLIHQLHHYFDEHLVKIGFDRNLGSSFDLENYDKMLNVGSRRHLDLQPTPKEEYHRYPLKIIPYSKSKLKPFNLEFIDLSGEAFADESFLGHKGVNLDIDLILRSHQNVSVIFVYDAQLGKRADAFYYHKHEHQSKLFQLALEHIQLIEEQYSKVINKILLVNKADTLRDEFFNIYAKDLTAWDFLQDLAQGDPNLEKFLIQYKNDPLTVNPVMYYSSAKFKFPKLTEFERFYSKKLRFSRGYGTDFNPDEVDKPLLDLEHWFYHKQINLIDWLYTNSVTPLHNLRDQSLIWKLNHQYQKLKKLIPFT